jgi:preprotein translocase subunit SecE
MGIIDYLRDTRGELRHVSWPTKTQVVNYTIVVIAISVVAGVFLGVLDFSFTKLFQKFIIGPLSGV